MEQTVEKIVAKWARPEETKQRESEIKALGQEDRFGFSPAVIEFLYNRGCRSGEDIEKYVENGPGTERNPFDMADVGKAVAHIIRAVNEQKRIVVFGDYDVDGISSTTIAVQCLRELGAKHVDYHINSRFKEGYGISPMGVDSLLAKFPNTELIVTVDNGIVAFDGVKYAVDKGIEVLVTDHHLAKPEIPEEALAVVNPHRHDDSSEFKEICGAAVIYKLMLAVFFELDRPLEFVYGMKDLVGMATVGDVMPLQDENRYYVREALRMIERETRPQFQVLRRHKNFTLDEQAFGFTIVPILNAVGRLEGTPTKAMEFFLTESEEEMEELAKELIAINEERKDITRDQEALAEEKLLKEGLSTVIVVADEAFHTGIAGLVAGRVKERYYRPAIVFHENDGMLVGSARSIEAFNIKEALDEISDHIVKHGGHEMAAGMTIRKEDLEAFKTAINEVADRILTKDDMRPVVVADSVLTPEEVTRELVEEFDRLRPFGQGFESPLLGLKDFTVGKSLNMGKEKNHLKLIDKASDLSLIMWSGAEQYKEMGSPNRVKALGSPSLNVYRDTISVQFLVKDDNLR